MALRSRSCNIRVSLMAVLLEQAGQVPLRPGEHLVHHAEQLVDHGLVGDQQRRQHQHGRATVVGTGSRVGLLVDIGMSEKRPHVSSSAL